jgi:hypothetical protein
MARARPIKYRFGKEAFTSQTAVMQHCAAMRARYGVGQTIGDPDDIAFLLDLVAGHIHSGDKSGVGVVRFYSDYAPEHGTTCFWLERADGSKTDFGVPSCIKKIGHLNKQSLREAIAPQLADFKARKLAACAGSFISEYSGKAFPVAEAVADHVTTFDSIVDRFFQERGVDIGTEMLTRSVDATSSPVWRNPDLIEEFLAFHRSFPLRLVQARENLSEIKREANAARAGRVAEGAQSSLS